MITLPKHHFQVFHKQLPDFEILVTGMEGNNSCFFVSLQSTGENYCFGYEIPEGETIAASFHNILVMAAKFLQQCLVVEKETLSNVFGEYYARQ